jgi:hypothetical protein
MLSPLGTYLLTVNMRTLDMRVRCAQPHAPDSDCVCIYCLGWVLIGLAIGVAIGG